MLSKFVLLAVENSVCQSNRVVVLILLYLQNVLTIKGIAQLQLNLEDKAHQQVLLTNFNIM